MRRRDYSPNPVTGYYLCGNTVTLQHHRYYIMIDTTSDCLLWDGCCAISQQKSIQLCHCPFPCLVLISDELRWRHCMISSGAHPPETHLVFFYMPFHPLPSDHHFLSCRSLWSTACSTTTNPNKVDGLGKCPSNLIILPAPLDSDVIPGYFQDHPQHEPCCLSAI
jgi:hypothetical protein